MKAMENENLMRGLNAKMVSIERMMSELIGMIQDLSQRQKQMQFTMAGGFDPSSHTPKGEADTQLCDDCGKRKPRKDLMKKSMSQNDQIVIFTVCKGCFYNPTR
jgi:hypothetical protein